MTGRNDFSERVLIFAPFGRDGAAAAKVLRAGGVDALPCTSMSQLLASLRTGAGAAIIAEESFRQNTAEIVAWVQAQPPWSDFPFIVLTTQRTSGDANAARSELMNLLRNASFLERPLQTMTLVSAARAAVRARARQYEVRALLKEREQVANNLEREVRSRTAELTGANAQLQAEIAEREAAQAALLQAQKMEALGRMTGGVAHDFNNLLTAVIGNLDLAVSRAVDERQRRHLSHALEASQRGSRLTAQLLAFSRKQALTPKPVDLNTLVEDMRPMLTSTLGSNVRLELNLDSGCSPAHADATQLELAVLNLAINARDAMPGGGTLEISTGHQALTEPGPAGLQPGQYVMIGVRDTGEGIPREVLSHIFEPFFTTKPLGRGTGLGLSQVLGLAQQLGGGVAVESTPAKGTEVIVYLPRAEGVFTPQPAERRERPRLDLTVLVVDDDALVRASTARTLESLGCLVLQAESGRDAALILERAPELNAVLTDLRMPDGSGADVYRLVQRSRPEVPVAIMTGYADAEEIPPDAPLLRKPFRSEDLAQLLAGLIYRPGPQERRGASRDS